jgi:hypothetical protein
MKALLPPRIPAYSRLPRNDQDRPLTPEVAGSSPVAPVSVSVALAVGPAASTTTHLPV